MNWLALLLFYGKCHMNRTGRVAVREGSLTILLFLGITYSKIKGAVSHKTWQIVWTNLIYAKSQMEAEINGLWCQTMGHQHTLN